MNGALYGIRSTQNTSIYININFLYLKNIAFLPTKLLRVHMNSFKRVREFQIELEFGSVGF